MATEEDTFNALRKPDFDSMKGIVRARVPLTLTNFAIREQEESKVLAEYGWTQIEYMRHRIARIQVDVGKGILIKHLYNP